MVVSVGRIQNRGAASLAAADLAWRARASDKATRRGRLPGLLSVVLRGSGGSRRHRRLRSPFYRGGGPCGTSQGVVLLEAAVFVFAARTAWAGLVAPRSSNRPSSHGTSVHPSKLVCPLHTPDWRHPMRGRCQGCGALEHRGRREQRMQRLDNLDRRNSQSGEGAWTLPVIESLPRSRPDRTER